VHGPPPPSHAELNAAFAAVWGAPPPATHSVRLSRETSLDYQVRPVTLVPLGHGRFALVEKETTEFGAHAAAGAASIAYLEKQHGRWRRLGNWPEIAWNGESGGDNLRTVVRRDLGRDPVVLATGSYLGQGDLSETAVVVRLGRDKPVALGRIPLGASNIGSASPDEHDYHAHVSRGHGGAMLEVTYRGWTGPRKDSDHEEPDPKFRRTYRQIIRFVLRDGCLAPVGGARPPELDFGPDPRDCTATAPAKP